jgi:AcrR family transcriptional regulator
MTRVVKPRRAYDSPRRREQARATRRSLLAAADALFRERGYVGTTIEAIAERAEVAPETVYATFRSKRALLTALFDVLIAGDDEPVALLERAWVGALRAEPDARRRARRLAAEGTRILQRLAPIYAVLQGAAAADAQIAEVLQRYRTQRLAGQRALVRMLAGADSLRPGLTASGAGDVLFALGSPEMYLLLVGERGWSAARFERWFADALSRLLLA